MSIAWSITIINNPILIRFYKFIFHTNNDNQAHNMLLQNAFELSKTINYPIWISKDGFYVLCKNDNELLQWKQFDLQENAHAQVQV